MKTTVHGFANSLEALELGIFPPFLLCPWGSFEVQKKKKNFIYLGNRVIIPRLWTPVRRKALTSGTLLHKTKDVWAYARQKWVSGPFDGNPWFQNGTQAKHNKQWKLIARGKVVFIMDCICMVYCPALINHSQTGTASWFHWGASPKQQLCHRLALSLVPPSPVERQSKSHTLPSTQRHKRGTWRTVTAVLIGSSRKALSFTVSQGSASIN